MWPFTQRVQALRGHNRYRRYRRHHAAAAWPQCLLALVLASSGVSCTRVVDLHLKSVPSSLVIEAVVSNGSGGCFVKISHSVAFKASSSSPLVTGATVVISDSNRHLTDTLAIARTAEGDSVYATRKIRATSGHVYTLQVTLDGVAYAARSVMPDSVTFQGISLLSNAGELNAASVFTAVPRFKDPQGKGNCYQFFQYINGKKDKGINVFNDNIGDGLPNEQPIFTQDIDIKLGDTLTVVMLNINPDIYRIFYQLQQNADDFGVTPSNPQTNIQGGALGYFSAQYRQSLTARIEPDP